MTITIYHPSRDFVQVSLTGDSCALKCPHCRGRFLRHMEPAMSPAALYALAERSAARGVRGMLLSGGCDAEGQVPVFDYLDIIENIKKNISISINLHTGFIDLARIPELAGKGIDAISFDVIGSPDVVKRIHGLDLGPGYFGKALDAFKEAGLNAVPHITAGLDRGLDSGEMEALGILAPRNPRFLVVNALMSSEGSERSLARMLEVLRMASEMLPSTALGIGCMRPRGDWLDARKVAELGIAAIAMPSGRLVRELRAMGVPLEEKGGCCAFL